jgi:hypothetical protein
MASALAGHRRRSNLQFLQYSRNNHIDKIITCQAITLAIAAVGAVLGITDTCRNITRDMLRDVVDESVQYIYYVKLEARL